MSTIYARLANSIERAARLRCPRCGKGHLFERRFRMFEQCPVCHLVFEREPGYFVGAIYVNYTATALLTIGGFLLMDAYTSLSVTTQLCFWGIVGVAFPICFFRHSKSLWMAIDHFLNPEEPQLRVVAGRRI